MTKRRIVRSILSVFLSLVLIISGFLPGMPFVSTVHAETATKTITPGTDEAKTGTGTMEISLTIKKTPAAGDFTFTPPTSLIYDGQPKAATVVKKDEVTGMGEVTVEYYNGDTKLNGAPTAEGTYTVKVNVAEGDDYKDATDITDDSWTFTILPMQKTMTITLVIHGHEFTYGAEGATITATCSGTVGTCDLTDKKVSLTLNAPEKKKDTDSLSASATVDADKLTAFNEATGLSVTAEQIEYYSGSTKLDAAPTGQGNYTAKLTVEGATASVDYSIGTSTQTATMTITLVIKETPTASDFDVTKPANLGYNGSAKTVTAVAKTGITGMGAVSVEYYSGETKLTDAPKNVGTYTFKLNVAEGDGYKAAVLTDDSWTFTITAIPTYTVTFDSNGGTTVTAQTVEKDQKAAKPDDPTNGDLHFVGWFVDPTIDNIYIITEDSYDLNTFDFENTAITSDITLKAVWTAPAMLNIGGFGSGLINYAASDETLNDEYFQSAYISSFIGIYDSFIIDAKPNEGNRFIKWQKVIQEGTDEKDPVYEDYSTNAQITLKVTEPISLEAVFEIIEPKVVTEPKAKSLTYTGTAQELVTAGTAEDGVIYYAVGDTEPEFDGKTDSADKKWSTSVPKGKDAGVYKVWYMAVGDSEINYSLPESLTVFIQRKPFDAPAVTVNVSGDAAVATISGWDKDHIYEYAYATAGEPADEAYYAVDTTDGVFAVAGTDPGTAYTLYVRRRPKGTDNNYTVSNPGTAAFTSPAKFTVAYDLNGGALASGQTLATATGDSATGTKAVLDANAAEKLTRTGYDFVGWAESKDSSVYVTETAKGTIYAIWKAHYYTVAYDANGGTGTMAAQTFAYDTAKSLSANQFTKEGFTFIGWTLSKPSEDSTYYDYIDGQTVKNLTDADNATVTVYAVWAENTYGINVKLTSLEVKDVDCTLKKGNAVFAEKKNITGTIGDDETVSFETGFDNVPNGTYNIVAVQKVGEVDRTITAIVVISGANATVNVELPAGDYSSTLKVEDDAKQIVVGGLDEVAKTESEAVAGVETKIEMTIETAAMDDSDAVTTKQSETNTAIYEIEAKAGDTTSIEFLNIDITRSVTIDETSYEDSVRETSNVLELIIPYDFSEIKPEEIRMFRYHDGECEELTRITSATGAKDGEFIADKANSCIRLFASKFSTYAIAFKETKQEENNNESGYVPYIPVTPSTTSTTSTTYTIKFDANGGTGTMASQAGTGATTISANTLKRDGYTFTGWNTKADGSGVNYKDKNSISLSADIILYAQWKKVETVTPTPEPAPTDIITAEEAAKAYIDINAGLKVYPKNKAIVVKWGKVDNADKYVVYASYCKKGSKKCVKIATLDGDVNSYKFSELNGKKINTKKNIKVYVVAYRKVDGKNKKITKTIKTHIVGSSSKKYSNVKDINVESTKIILSVDGNTTAPTEYKLSPTAVLKDSSKKMLLHTAEFRYATSDSSVAEVDKNGVITAQGTGSCYIYVYAQNGYAKKIKVTVK